MHTPIQPRAHINRKEKEEEIGGRRSRLFRSQPNWWSICTVSQPFRLSHPAPAAALYNIGAVLNDYELIGGRHNAAQFMSSRPVKSLLSRRLWLSRRSRPSGLGRCLPKVKHARVRVINFVVWFIISVNLKWIWNHNCERMLALALLAWMLGQQPKRKG